MTDLGVLIDSQLSFSPHIDTVCTKAKQRAALILNCLCSRNKYLLIRAFIAYARPLLEYCCSVWSPSKLGLIDKLENIHRRFTTRLHGLRPLSYSERLKLKKIDSLECIKADLIIFLTLFHQLIDLEFYTFFDISNSNTRGHNFKNKHFSVNNNGNEFSNRSVNVWNSLSDAVVNCKIVTIYLNLYIKVLTLINIVYVYISFIFTMYLLYRLYYLCCISFLCIVV